MYTLLMALRMIVDDVTFEADTPEELMELRQRLASPGKAKSISASLSASPSGGGAWPLGKADAFFRELKALAQETVRELARTPARKAGAGEIAKRLKRGTHALGPAMKNIENVARAMKVTPPVRKIDAGGTRLLVIDDGFVAALQAAKTI